MRGTSSSAKMRLRSGGYKCTICGRRVVDAALLERHLKNMHNIPSKGKKVVFKAKAQPQSKEEMDKKFDDLIREEVWAVSKTKAKNKKRQESDPGEDPLALTAKDIKKDPVHQTENVDNNSDSSKNVKREYVKRRPDFECPVCGALFNAYYTAHKHIQRMHPINAVGEKVPTYSPDLIQPIRVEQCLRCFSKMKSNEPHICQNTDSPSFCQYVCTLCNHSFITLKSFDSHVAGLHSKGVESMFFPTEIELTNWRLEMERETNAKYVVVGGYDGKKVYRCTHTKKVPRPSNISQSVCPSAMVIQDFAKGTQVHFYPEHSDHHAKMYPETLSTKYLRYSISTFLKSPGDLLNLNFVKNSSNKGTYEQFRALMEGIIVDAKKLDVARLKILVEKALDMTTILNEEIKVAKPNKSMTDKEITDVLEEKPQKRRISADCVNPSPPSAAKRTRNKSLFVSDDLISPKIINTYSLATDLKTDAKVTNSKPKSPLGVTTETEKPMQMSLRSTRFNQSPSFNDTYKDFIDKTIKAATHINKSMRPRKCGTKIDETVQHTSPSVSETVKVTNNVTKKTVNDVTITLVETPKPLRTYKPSPKIRMEKFEIGAPPSAKKPKMESKESPEFETSNAKKPLDEKSSAKKPLDEKSNAKKPLDEKSSAKKPLDEKSSAKKPLDEKSSVKKPLDEKFSVKKPLDEKSSAKKPLDEKSIANKPLDFKYEVVEQENDCNILVLKF